MRGSPVGLYVFVLFGRSIPACAGEPYSVPLSGAIHRVYPRVCGGAASRTNTVTALWGLSPRVRGSPNLANTCSTDLRSIPACAGEPSSGDIFCSSSTVYPRVCGGAVTNKAAIAEEIGLSPRVRGSPLALGARVIQARSIPACAGEPPATYRGR